MYKLNVEIIMSVIRFIYVLESLCEVRNIKIKQYKKMLYLIIYSIGYFVLEDEHYQSYLFQYIFFFIVISFIVKSSKIKMIDLISQVCIFIIIFEMVNLVGNVLAALTAGMLNIVFLKISNVAIFFAFLIKGIALSWILQMERKYQINIKMSFLKQCLTCFAYFLVVCIKIPFLYTDINDAFEWKVIFLTIICCTVIFFIISKIERHNAEKEKARIEEKNKILSIKLHKSREILPAMVQVLSNVTENSGMEMEQQEVQELLQEVNNLYGQQLKENLKEDLQLKSFCSTGLKVLDQQLLIYQKEAIDKEINFDIYVQVPINDILKKDDIDQLRLQRALGDLVRNAFCSIEKKNQQCRIKGHILLIIGCQCKDILEIAVVDNGVKFPLHVIEAFGKRGVTTGGTGNGLADIVEFAKEINASIYLNEFDGKTDSFTKKLSIIFDKQGTNILNSARRGSVTDSFWNII